MRLFLLTTIWQRYKTKSDMVFLCRCSDGVLPLAHYVAFLDLPAGWFQIINSQSGSFKIFGFRGQCSEQKRAYTLKEHKIIDFKKCQIVCPLKSSLLFKSPLL